MLRKEFDKNLKIKITEIGVFEKREIEVKRIKSFKDNEKGQAVIKYTHKDNLDEVEEIITEESSKRIAELIDGEPPEDEMERIRKRVISERQAASRERLNNIETDYERDRDKGSEGTERAISDANSRLRQVDEEIEQCQKLVDKSRRAKFLQKQKQKIESLQDRIDKAYERSGLIGWLQQKRSEMIDEKRLAYRETLHNVMSFGRVGITVTLLADFKEEKQEKERWIKQLEENREREKERRRKAFESERQKLIRLRDDPQIKDQDLGRLEAKIREYRLEHGDNHHFKFERQKGGVYENTRSKEFQERQREAAAERAKELSDRVRERQGGRSRRRYRSRSRDRGMER